MNKKMLRVMAIILALIMIGSFAASILVYFI